MHQGLIIQTISDINSEKLRRMKPILSSFPKGQFDEEYLGCNSGNDFNTGLLKDVDKDARDGINKFLMIIL